MFDVLQNSTDWFGAITICNTDFDSGGLGSLVITLAFLTIIVIIYVVNSKNSLKESIKTAKFRYLLSIPLFAILFLSVWQGIRAILLYCYRYLFVNGFNYTPSDLFIMLISIFVSIGIFKLINNLWAGHTDFIGPLLDTAIQSSIFGLILFLPFYYLMGSWNFLIIILAFCIALGCLLAYKKYLLIKTDVKQ